MEATCNYDDKKDNKVIKIREQTPIHVQVLSQYTSGQNISNKQITQDDEK